MANPWFRLYSEFATDPKVQMMSESYQRRFIMLLCIRCNGDVTLQKQKANALDTEQNRTDTEEKSAGKPAEPSGFAEFWQTWPSNTRKGAKGKCLEVWKKSHAERDAAQVLAHVESMKNSASWQKNGGEFIPAPLVYLNKRSWEGAELTATATADIWAGAVN